MCHEYWLLPLLCVGYCHALIVPQELPSILSLIFSTIPQVKKGTDSRVGFGFRLGEHADIQVMLELGPQKETQRIGPDSLQQTSKRNVNQYDYDQGGTATVTSSSSSNGNEGENWLKNWSNGMQAKRKKPSQITMSSILNNENYKNNNNNNDDGDDNGKLIKVVPLIPESALKQLQILYGKNSTNDNNEELTNSNSNSDSDSNSRNSGNLENLENFKGNVHHHHQMTKGNKDQITAELSDVTMD